MLERGIRDRSSSWGSQDWKFVPGTGSGSETEGLSSLQVQVGRDPQRIHIYATSDHQRWLASVVESLERISLYTDSDWDGYGGAPVSWDAIEASMRVLASVMDPESPIPDIAPLSSGGVEISWERTGVSLIIEIFASGNGTVFFEDLTRAVENELPLEVARPDLEKMLLAVSYAE